MKQPEKLTAIVYVVEDDAPVRDSLDSLFRSIDLQVVTFGTAEEFLQRKLEDVPSCLVLDVRLPGLDGLDCQIELAKAGVHIPIIFITGDADVPMAARAMKTGAIEFLTKPFREADLLNAVQLALEKDRGRRRQE